jgi:hypothetical protein
MWKSSLVWGGMLILATVILLATVAAALALTNTSIRRPIQLNRAAIDVSTYIVGGPHRTGRQLVSNASVRLREAGGGRRLIRQARHTNGGNVVFVVKPGAYRLEAALEPPAVVPSRRCGPPSVVHVRGGMHIRVSFYCSVP